VPNWHALTFLHSKFAVQGTGGVAVNGMIFLVTSIMGFNDNCNSCVDGIGPSVSAFQAI
jgi:hypothetical protein